MTPNNTPLAITRPISVPKVRRIVHNARKPATVVREEAITGSSRMKSGTAQKMVLNMLSTASMVKIGKTYGNYMIDLQPVCDKLIDRANRIIAAICKIPVAKAETYRIKADNNVKVACVMYLKGCTKQQAKQKLKKHNGILRKVLRDEK